MGLQKRGLVAMKALDRHRLGFSLLELMIAMAFSVTIMGVLSALVTKVIASNSTAGERLNDLTTLGQLSRQFRRDVHNATHAVVSPKEVTPASLSLTLDDHNRIEYAIHDGVLRRTQSSAGRNDRWDEYPLHASRVLGWKASDDSREVTLAVGRLIGTTDESTQFGRTFEVVSQLGEIQPTFSPAGPAAPGKVKE